MRWDEDRDGPHPGGPGWRDGDLRWLTAWVVLILIGVTVVGLMGWWG